MFMICYVYVDQESRQINPNKDMALYGYGTIAWKEKIEEWRQKELVKYQSSAEGGGYFNDIDLESPDLLM
jgi:cellulose synthase A